MLLTDLYFVNFFYSINGIIASKINSTALEEQKPDELRNLLKEVYLAISKWAEPTPNSKLEMSLFGYMLNF